MHKLYYYILFVFLIIIPIVLTIGLLLVSRFFEKVERQIRKGFNDRN